MALVALTIASTITYVSDRDPSKQVVDVPIDPEDLSKGAKKETRIGDGATKFFLKPLDVFLKGYIYDNATHLVGKSGTDDVGIHTRINQTNIDAVRFGLAGFENFSDASGNPVKFKTVKDNVNGREYDAVATDVLNTLGLELIGELASQIKSASEVSAEEAKNSEPA